MKLLVTGGSGFIGSAVIRHIIGHTDGYVVNLDCLTYAGSPESLEQAAKSPRYSFEKADITNRQEIDYILETHKPDKVLHLAAESHVDRSIDGPQPFINTNIVGTYNLLEACRHYWCSMDDERKKRFCFHHVSTDEVYGDLKGSTQAFTETTPYAPNSPYAASKASSDHLVRAWQQTFGLPCIITHSSNNYGPYQFPEKLVPLTIVNALEGKPISIYGSGQQIRDWLYVEEHAAALYKVLTNGERGQVYNIGGNAQIKNIELVTLICKLLDQNCPPQSNNLPIKSYAELITHVSDRPGHDAHYAMNIHKIELLLGWSPTVALEFGLQKTIMWYLNNMSWVHSLQPRYGRERLGTLGNN